MKKIFSTIILFSLIVCCSKIDNEPNLTNEPCKVSSIKYNNANPIDYFYSFDKTTNTLTSTSNNKTIGKYVYDSNDRLVESNTEKYKYDIKGRLTEINLINYLGGTIFSYVYKENLIEKYSYRNLIADANLFEIGYYTIDDKQNVTKIEQYIVSSDKQTLRSTTNRTYNSKGQELTINETSNSINSFTRFEYDATDNIKIYFKSGNSKEYLKTEFLNPIPIPQAKKEFKDWQLIVSEPFQFGSKTLNHGTIKNYNSSGKLTDTITQQFEYDSNNILIKHCLSTDDLNLSKILDFCLEKVISCPN